MPLQQANAVILAILSDQKHNRPFHYTYVDTKRKAFEYVSKAFLYLNMPGIFEKRQTLPSNQCTCPGKTRPKCSQAN